MNMNILNMHFDLWWRVMANHANTDRESAYNGFCAAWRVFENQGVTLERITNPSEGFSEATFFDMED